MPPPLISVLLEGERLEGRLLDRLSRIEIRESDMDPTVATLRFGLVQRPGGDYAPIDDDRFTAAAPIAVEIAAPGGLPTRIFDGFVTHVRPHFEAIESNAYVEILAMDAAALLDAEDRAASYPDVSDAEAYEQVLSRYQISANAETTDARRKEDEQLLVQRSSDWQFVQQLARRNGFVTYFEFDDTKGETSGHFRRPPLDVEPQADLTILRKNANLVWADFQLSLNGPVRHVAAAIDPIEKRMIRSDAQPELAALGDSAIAEAVEQGLRKAGVEAPNAHLRDPFPSDAALQAATRGASERDGLALEVRGELDPSLYRGLLRARRPVLIKGVGDRLSGSYYVRSVLTAVDEGEVSQSFVGVANALGRSGRESFGQEAEEVPAE